jgi:hypothetical protein
MNAKHFTKFLIKLNKLHTLDLNLRLYFINNYQWEYFRSLIFEDISISSNSN